MLSSLPPLFVVVGLLCWVVLPGLILLVAVVGPRPGTARPVWVRRCQGSDPAAPCWVTREAEYCRRHEVPPAQHRVSGRELFIA